MYKLKGHNSGPSDSCLDAVREARLGGCPGWSCVCVCVYRVRGKGETRATRLGPGRFNQLNRLSRSAAAPVPHRFLVPSDVPVSVYSWILTGRGMRWNCDS